MTVHNAEEALSIHAYVAVIRERTPPWAADIGRLITIDQLWLALTIVTLAPIILAVWLARAPHSRWPTWSLLLVQATLLLNAFGHLVAAVWLFRGYAPGLFSAVGLNLPLSVYLLGRARREGWVSSRALVALLPGAVVLHGPLLLGLLRWSEWRFR